MSSIRARNTVTILINVVGLFSRCSEVLFKMSSSQELTSGSQLTLDSIIISIALDGSSLKTVLQ